MNYHEFPINQSIIKEFLHNGEEKEFCYKKVYLTRIVKTMKAVTSLPMSQGRYFETGLLGKSSGSPLRDLPRKNLTKKQLAENAVRKKEGRPLLLGEKYLDHIRIDDQITRAKALAEQYRIIITPYNVQVRILTVWDQDPDVLLSAELDIFPTTILLDNKLEAAIIDVKLTADIHSEYGEYCYGKPEYLDLIQAKMYHYVVRNINKSLNPDLGTLITETIESLILKNKILFLLWVFNYKGKILEDKFIKVEWDKYKEAELHESIRKTISILEFGEKQDWPTNPVYSQCKNCPWTQCPDKVKVETV